MKNIFTEYSDLTLVKILKNNDFSHIKDKNEKHIREEMSKKEAIVVMVKKCKYEYEDIINGFIWSEDMFEYFKPEIGSKIKVIDNLYSYDHPFGLSSEMEKIQGETITIERVFEDTGSYNCQYDIKIQENYNHWSITMFDWSTYKSPHALLDDVIEDIDVNRCYKDKDNDFDKGDYAVLRDEVIPGKCNRDLYVPKYFEDLKNQIFYVRETHADGTLEIRTYNNKFIDCDDLSIDDTYKEFFRKIEKDSIVKIDYLDSLINSETQYVKFTGNFDKKNNYIFTTDDENYNIVQLTKKEKKFLSSLSYGDVFKVKKYLPEEKNELDYITISKISGGTFEASRTICDIFFKHYEPDTEDYFGYSDEEAVNINLPVKFNDTIKLGKFYDCGEKIVYVSNYFEDIIDQTLVICSDATCKNGITVVKCKMQFMGDAVGSDYIVPLGMLVNVEEKLESLRFPTLKPGNLVTFKKNLKIGKKYKNYLTNEIEIFSPTWKDYEDSILEVSSSSENITICKKDYKACIIPTMFLNLVVKDKGQSVIGGLNTVEELEKDYREYNQIYADGIPIFEKQNFKPTDKITLRENVVNKMTYSVDGVIYTIPYYKDVEEYRGKVLLFSDCQDDGNEIRFYHNGCIHCLDKNLFRKINEKNTEKERGNVFMKNLGLGNVLNKMFGEIGVVSDGSLALTLTGKVAIKRNDGDYVRYDEENQVMENQGELIFPGSEKFMMLMPTNTVAVGDIIKKDKKYYQVLEIKSNGTLKAVDFATGHNANILKETNLFNMNFYTKVVSFMTGFNGDTGNGMNQMMMLLLTQNDGDKEMDLPTMIMISSMFGGQAQTGMNPMMMLLMLKGGDVAESTDLVQTIMLSQMFNGNNNIFGNMFGVQQPVVTAPAPKQTDDTCDEVDKLKEIVASQSKALESALEELRTLKAAGKSTTSKTTATKGAK